MSKEKEPISIYDRVKIVAKQEAKKKKEHADKYAEMFDQIFKEENKTK